MPKNTSSASRNIKNIVANLEKLKEMDQGNLILTIMVIAEQYVNILGNAEAETEDAEVTADSDSNSGFESDASTVDSDSDTGIADSDSDATVADSDSDFGADSDADASTVDSDSDTGIADSDSDATVADSDSDFGADSDAEPEPVVSRKPKKETAKPAPKPAKVAAKPVPVEAAEKVDFSEFKKVDMTAVDYKNAKDAELKAALKGSGLNTRLLSKDREAYVKAVRFIAKNSAKDGAAESYEAKATKAGIKVSFGKGRGPKDSVKAQVYIVALINAKVISLPA